jgi:hypothetical protein
VNNPIYIVIAVILFAVGITISWFAAIAHHKKVYESKVGSAEEKSR